MRLIESELIAYCEQFLRVIKAGFGQDKQVCATIFQEQTETPLSIRLIAIYLNKPSSRDVESEFISSVDLIGYLQNFKKLCPEWKQLSIEDVFYQEDLLLYDSVELNGVKIPTVFFVKPDKSYYWTLASASEDANQVAADIFEAGISTNENQ